MLPVKSIRVPTPAFSPCPVPSRHPYFATVTGLLALAGTIL